MSTPLVSVRIITYNHGPYIRQALEGVLMQKVNFSWQMIIADDYSTDGTRDILIEYQQKYPDKIRLILQQKNVGAAKNWSDLMANLNTKYTAYFEGDDYWTDENKLQMQVDALDKDPTATLCFTEVAFWNENKKENDNNWLLPFINKNRFTCSDMLDRNLITTCSVLFRNIFTELPDGILNFPFTDWPLYLFLLTKGDAIYIPTVTATYRLHNTGIFSGLQEEHKNKMTLKIYETLLTYPQFNSYSNKIKKLISERAYIAFCFEMKHEKPDREQANTFFTTSLKNINLHNIYFPLKTFLRKSLFFLNGKGFSKA